MHLSLKHIMAFACMTTLIPCSADATEADDALAGRSTQVAGQQLQLNGVGVSTRLMFKVYTIGLYLRDPRRTTEAVLSSSGPRRLMIRLMRDLSSDDFEKAVMDRLAKESPNLDAHVAEQMQKLSQAIASLPTGLRCGDLLTLDWIPDKGTVIEHNQRRIAPPMQDIAFYNALLNIWLGEQPADPRLKIALLGREPS
ncbi:chalcone isomerase family protein [Comamonas composti]|uniref:chalcone isomerase family protein n=1 Tax=Comamonas composti TaxID=408558 RepID=UPI000685239A|nr:chalcone isomerase family protein [Comamonas composti]